MTGVIATDKIGIIILAAGSSRRFGADKRRARLADDRTLLEATLSCVPNDLHKRILVLRPGDEDLGEQFLPDWEICMAGNADAGMASSLSSGIAQAMDWSGALIGLGDMPFIAPATYSAIQSALTSHDIVIPCVNQQRGNPVGFREKYFGEIGDLAGDRGAKALLDKYSGECIELDTADRGILRDIDSPDMLI